METQKLYRGWPPGEWASKLPPSYFDSMGLLVDDMLRNLTQAEHDNGYFEYVKCRNVFGRMEICEQQLMPWIRRSIPELKDLAVMEIGCGTGSATVPLALSSRHVYPFDLDAETVEIAGKRCSLLDVGNVSPFSVDVMWTANYARNPSSVCAAPVEVIVSYALMEHLLPMERIQLLVGAWKHLPLGGYLIVIEAPNRLYPFDWHSTQQSFTELPDELYYLWNAFSARPTIPPSTVARAISDIPSMNRDRSYRFGRGVSFHEFEIALGHDAYEVVSSLDRMSMQGTVQSYIDALKEQLGSLTPPIHEGFAYPSLDLVIRKTGNARLTE